MQPILSLRRAIADTSVIRRDLAPHAAAADAARVCLVCTASQARYECPRCHIAYCAAACYRRHSERCTEAFYAEHVRHVLSAQREDTQPLPAAASRDREAAARAIPSLSTAHASHDDDDDDAMQWSRMQALQLLAASGDEIPEGALTAAELEAFHASVRGGTLASTIARNALEWSPWWSAEHVHDLESPPVDSVAPCAIVHRCAGRAALHPTPFEALYKGAPSETLRFHVLDVLTAYTAALRLQACNVDSRDECVNAVAILSSCSAVLSQDARHDSVAHALHAVIAATCNAHDLKGLVADSHAFTVLLLNDVQRLLNGREAVNDALLHMRFMYVMMSPLRTAVLKRQAMKMAFLASYAAKYMGRDSCAALAEEVQRAAIDLTNDS